MDEQSKRPFRAGTSEWPRVRSTLCEQRSQIYYILLAK
nr:MAG TPA: hypothetical protein [Caudoviricetes sp.]